MKLNTAREEFADMVNSVVDRSEQRQLAPLFVELEEKLHKDGKLAGLVTFWRRQLHARIEPSYLSGAARVLDALSDSPMGDVELHRSVRHWHIAYRPVPSVMASRQATTAIQTFFDRSRARQGHCGCGSPR
ncbi:MAG TPA: hypothetical protein VGC06_00700 [Actinomycetes bacterium]